MSSDQRASHARPALTADGLRAAERIELLGGLPGASNATLLVRLFDGADRETGLAVYKPRAGEAPLWDFPEGTLCNREVAAFEVSRALGWPNVPDTVIRDGPLGPGAFQAFVRFDPQEHAFSLFERHPDDFRRIAAFDIIVNNADRKGGHCLLGEDGRIWAIDHGICFAAEPKLRTVLWNFAREPLPDDLLADVAHLAADLSEGGTLWTALEHVLDQGEVEASRTRAEALVQTRRYPEPGTARAFPWPPV